jgi:hypothetical protein
VIFREHNIGAVIATVRGLLVALRDLLALRLLVLRRKVLFDISDGSRCSRRV